MIIAVQYTHHNCAYNGPEYDHSRVREFERTGPERLSVKDGSYGSGALKRKEKMSERNQMSYPVGENELQTRRLITQAQLYDPSTRAFFQAAGIGKGMKVLEL